MGEASKKKHAAAKAARKAKKDAEQASQPVEGRPASIDPILSSNKPLNSSDSKYSKKLKAVPQEKMPHTPWSIFTHHSTHSRSTLAAVSSGSGEQCGSNVTLSRCLATTAAETLLQQVWLVEDRDFEEDLDGNSHSKEEIELDDNEDGNMIGGDNRSSGDDIEIVEGGEIELGLAALTTQQSLARVLAVFCGAQKKVPKVQVIEEEESSDEEFSEFVCWVIFGLRALMHNDRNLWNDNRGPWQS